MASTQVLVVDADRDSALSVADRARNRDWDVLIAIGADEALRMVDEKPITVALADSAVWLDQGLAKALSAQHPALPVIVLADSQTARDDLVAQLQLGAMTYIPRDADSRRLVETVRNLIDLASRSPHRERIREFLLSGEVRLHIGSDLSLVAVVVGYIQRVLEDYGLSEQREHARVGLALSEAISNAIIHGNLEISSETRNGDADEYYRQIEARRDRPPYNERTVHITMGFTQSSATFVIRDQGAGFDLAAVADPTDDENLMAASGRGILLMRSYCDAVSWNDPGNEVTLVKTLNS